MSVSMLTESIGRAVDECASDGISCEQCPLFNVCDTYLGTECIRFRSEREIVDKVNEFRYWKNWIADMEVKQMVKTTDKKPTLDVISAVNRRYCCAECGGALKVRFAGRHATPYCPEHPGAGIVRLS